eukprot:PLAT12219.2.p4 GENE.PLAT12219.2~~PLAT12219.2.p4  ORF type:complete len:107 (-),score=79.77 PLAT12219.2:56-376(-)
MAQLVYKWKLLPESLRTGQLRMLVAILAVLFLLGFSSLGVDMAAHIGGLLTGAALGLILLRPSEEAAGSPRLPRFAAGFLAVFVLVVVITLVAATPGVVAGGASSS